MVTALDVVRVAESQVGYHEQANAAGTPGPPWNNYQKYSLQTPGMAWSNAQAWCATFVSWCAWKAGASALLPRTASVAAARDWYKARGRFSRTPTIGAQVIFGVNGDAHTGIVIAITPSTIVTIEGNTNDNGSAEGDGVYRKVRDRSSSWIYGYGHPAYAPPVAPKPVPTVSLLVMIELAHRRPPFSRVVLPARRRMVTILFAALKAEGCATYRAWQLKLGYRGADADGIPGHDSLTKLASRHGFRVTP